MLLKPYIIAELSGNHNGDINRAFQLMEEAKKAGADAVKLQTYTADTITMNHNGPDFLIKGGLWDGYKLYDLYNEAHTPWDWHPALFAKGKELGIAVFSTPFDETAVDLLEDLEAPLYKIASFELVHHPLIKYVAQTGKPMIMSTGMASLEEITEAVQVAKTSGCNDLTLLHCVSAYPADIEDCNLATMVDLKARFPGVKIGLSDHTLGTTVAIVAVALGAQVIEKHFTLARSEGGVDAAFSLEPAELKYLCQEAANAVSCIGKVAYERGEKEKENMIFRRSIYAIKDIKEGEPFTRDNIRVIRPGFGCAPKYFETLLEKKAPKKLSAGDRIIL
jgi:N-acetylneuraminate synthase